MAKLITEVNETENINGVRSFFVNDNDVLKQVNKDIFVEWLTNLIENTKINGYVPTSRAVAGIDLEDDITDVELSRALLPRLLNDSENTPLFASTVTKYINNNTNVSANTSARHTHDNKEFLDSLSEDTVRPYWKLIKKVKLEEAVSSIEINKNDDENINSYNRFRIIFPIVNMTKTNTVWVRLYDRNGVYFNFAATMDIESDSKIKFEIPIINKDYIYMETLVRKGTGETSAACLTRETAVESSDCVVNKIRIDSSFDVGTEVYVYGGTD